MSIDPRRSNGASHGDASATEDPPLTESQALLTAWLDGELPLEDLNRFERMMADDPKLAAEAAGQKVLVDLAVASGRLEPTEQEIRRFWSGFYNRTEWRLGWVLVVGGLVALFAFGCYELACANAVHGIVKFGIFAALAGGALLLASTVRQRLRTRSFDRYRGVSR